MDQKNQVFSLLPLIMQVCLTRRLYLPNAPQKKTREGNLQPTHIFMGTTRGIVATTKTMHLFQGHITQNHYIHPYFSCHQVWFSPFKIDFPPEKWIKMGQFLMTDNNMKTYKITFPNKNMPPNMPPRSFLSPSDFQNSLSKKTVGFIQQKTSQVHLETPKVRSPVATHKPSNRTRWNSPCRCAYAFRDVNDPKESSGP